MMRHNQTVCTILGALSAVALSACQMEQSEQNFDASIAASTEMTAGESQSSTIVRKANAQDSCPHLVQKKVDSTTVLRQDSMVGRFCDYFIYPYVGETVQATISDHRIRLNLVRPDVHDFANGSYRVRKNGRHVLRLEYDAFGKRPSVMDYEIEIDIKPVAQ
ncbi:hypothetical protein [Moraxella marmotae]|uniref:hypothetical protein n=1 Tax=Moraxella marmotae TaxID=3344520 RepID=UPI0035F4FDF8